MVKISAIILTKNSENVLADCIDSISFCDEIIVIDDDSTDRTVDIAKRFGANVEKSNPTKKSFSRKREQGLKKTKFKWVLYIDSDERVSSDLKKSILEAVNKNNEFDAYAFPRKNFYLGNHEWPYIEKQLRLFKKSSLKGWHGQLHETPEIEGKIGELQGFLLHFTHRDLSSMIEKTISWSEIEAELRFRSNHPQMTWWRFPRVMATAFYQSYIKQQGFKAGTAGLIESLFQAFSIFITYSRLWEMQQKKVSENKEKRLT
jgi:hypothetical protein